MKNALDALHGAIERRGVAQISGHILKRQIRNRAIGARSAQKHAYFIAANHQLPRHVAAQEPRRACYQRGHATFTLSSFALVSCSMLAPMSLELRAASNPPLKIGSPIRENASHHMLPMSFRTSAIFRCQAAAFGAAEVGPRFPWVITIPSTSSECAN